MRRIFLLVPLGWQTPPSLVFETNMLLAISFVISVIACGTQALGRPDLLRRANVNASCQDIAKAVSSASGVFWPGKPWVISCEDP